MEQEEGIDLNNKNIIEKMHNRPKNNSFINKIKSSYNAA